MTSTESRVRFARSEEAEEVAFCASKSSTCDALATSYAPLQVNLKPSDGGANRVTAGVVEGGATSATKVCTLTVEGQPAVQTVVSVMYTPHSCPSVQMRGTVSAAQCACAWHRS